MMDEQNDSAVVRTLFDNTVLVSLAAASDDAVAQALLTMLPSSVRPSPPIPHSKLSRAH